MRWLCKHLWRLHCRLLSCRRILLCAILAAVALLAWRWLLLNPTHPAADLQAGPARDEHVAEIDVDVRDVRDVREKKPPVTQKPPLLDVYNDTQFYLPYSEDWMRDDLTVVSAFFDLGRFQKGEGDVFFSPNLYRRWMQSFVYLRNPVVMYVESEEDAGYFRELRAQALPGNMTVVHVISRGDLWAFSLLPRVRRVYAIPGYPKYHPNTVLPEYACAMHAKYELMRAAIMANHFRTKFFCWLDIGLFRSMLDKPGGEKEMFGLWLPPNFDPDKVAYTEVQKYIHDPIVDAKMIFTGNIVWLCGCFFISRAATLSRWTQDYMKATERYLQRSLMNTDQQVLYAMVKDGVNKVKVQTYPADGRFDLWFHLGYVCKNQAEKEGR